VCGRCSSVLGSELGRGLANVSHDSFKETASHGRPASTSGGLSPRESSAACASLRQR
jgi:hypothetical protein